MFVKNACIKSTPFCVTGVTTRTSSVSVRLYRSASQAVNSAARYSPATTRSRD